MVEEHEGVADDAGEETDRTVDAGAAELEVAEAAELEGFELGVCGRGGYVSGGLVISFGGEGGERGITVCGEEGVEGLSEDVDDGSEVFPLPVEGLHLLDYELSVS